MSEVAERTDCMRAWLRERFASDRGRYVIAEEVCADSYGSGRADALVLCTWRSDRFKVWGVEIKASRADWKRELARPAKAEVFARYCHRWVVLAWDGVVQPDEVPEGWGWWQYDGTRASERRRAPRRDAQPMDPYLLAQMARRLAEASPAAAYVGQAAAAAARRANHDAEWRAQKVRERVEQQDRTIDALREALRRLGYGDRLFSPHLIAPAPAVAG